MTLKDVLLKLQEMQLVALEKGILFEIDGYFGNVDPIYDDAAPYIDVWSRDSDDEVLHETFSHYLQQYWAKQLKIVETWIM